MTDIFGITGTNGKTTTAYMLAEILRTAARECALIGTVTHRIGNKVYEAINTTPGREVLANYLQEAQAQGIDAVVMEVSSHALVQGRVSEVPIQYAAFMNLTQDHLDYHKSMEEYYLAKKKLFDFKSLTSAIINIDDSYGRRLSEELLKEHPQLRQITISLGDETADLKGTILKEGFSGSEFMLAFSETVFSECAQARKFSLPRPGRHHIYDAMAALALAFSCGGFDMIDAAEDALAEFAGAPGRFEIITNPKKDIVAICDYAHTPDALVNLLRTVLEIKENDAAAKRGRIITVFGCGGDRDKTKRPLMGHIAGLMSDYTIITSDNPRSEDPLDIIGEIEEGLYDTAASYSVTADRRSAIMRAVMLARPGDIVVVAGKGHETYQIVGNCKKHFDDREILRELL